MIMNNIRRFDIKKNCRKFYTWMLLLAIAGASMLFSCTNSRPVRYGAGPYIVKKKAEPENPERNNPAEPAKRRTEESQRAQQIIKIAEEKQKQFEASEQSEEENLLSQTYYEVPENLQKISSKEEFAETHKRLPTLREQMQIISGEQERMNTRIGRIEEDVSEIKFAVEEIRNDIRNMTFSSPPSDDGPVAGARTNKAAPKNDPNLILSDEAIQKKKNPPVQIKKSAPKPKPQKSRERKAVKIVEKPQQAVEQEDLSPLEKTEFKSALNLVSRREFRTAIDRLNALLDKEKSPVVIIHCHYWIGESYFGLRKYGEAIKHFEQVLESGSGEKKADARVMIAEAHVRSGKVAEAREAFSQLIKEHPESEYVPRARKMLQML